MGMLDNGVWKDVWYDTKSTGGRFKRSTSSFRNWVTKDGSAGPSGDGGFKAEAGRYRLYVALICPWASRTLIARKLKSLDGVIPADEEIFLPDRVHLNFKGTKKLADYVADHLSKCKAARNALARKRRRRPACAREVLYDNAEML